MFPANCSYDYVTSSVTIDQPTEPVGYVGPWSCQWTMSVTSLNYIAVMFTELNVS